MRPFLLLLALVISSHAADLPVIAAPDFHSPLPVEWKIAHGTWEPKGGILSAAELPQNKHVAVIWHQVAWQQGIIECEFQFEGASTFIIGCDGNTAKGLKHIGRAVITPKMLSLAEDSAKPSAVLAKQPTELKPGQWHRLRMVWQGGKIILQVNDSRVEATHDYLASQKTRSWLAVGKEHLRVRALKISGK
jgi:hypothetical protein